MTISNLAPSAAQNAEPFERRYKLKDYRKLVLADEQTAELVDDLINGRLAGNLLLHGVSGTGKTSICSLVASAITGGISADVLFLNASELTSKTDVIPRVTRFSETLGFGTRRCIIFDECDGLDKKTQLALKGVIDKYQNFVTFMFTTNNFAKVDLGIRSRCTAHKVEPASVLQWFIPASEILAENGVLLDAATVLQQLKRTVGDNRLIMRGLERLVRQNSI